MGKKGRLTPKIRHERERRFERSEKRLDPGEVRQLQADLWRRWREPVEPESLEGREGGPLPTDRAS